MNTVVNHNPAFVGCAVLAVWLLVYACLFGLGLVATTGLRLGTAVAGYTLLLELLVGIFTVWGLFWAATEFSEFAMRPDIQLLPGEPDYSERLTDNPDFPLTRSRPFQVAGQRVTNHTEVRCGLYLENTSPRAARFVHMVLDIDASPFPLHCSFIYKTSVVNTPGDSQRISRWATDGNLELSVRFPDELVVYQSPVCVGYLRVVWDADTERRQLPELLSVDYDIYALDGASGGKLELHIGWG